MRSLSSGSQQLSSLLTSMSACHTSRWFTASVSALVLGALVGAAGGALCAGAAWLAGGSAGVGRFTQLGPNPLWTLVWVGAEIAIGAVVGYALAPWLERGQLVRADGV